MVALFAIMLCVYWGTLCTCRCPGQSALAMAQATGALPAAPVDHPVWLAAARIVAALPMAELPYRMNLFSALCGSLTVAWVFRVSRRVLFEMIRPGPAQSMVSAADDTRCIGPGLRNGTSVTVDVEREVKERVAATLGGVICALSLGLAAPHWIASTSLHAQTFDLLLFVVLLDCAAAYCFSGRFGFCVAAVFLSGALFVESQMLVLILCAVLALVLRACIRFGQISESSVFLLFAAGVSGFALACGFYWLQLGSHAGAVQSAAAFAAAYKAGLLRLVPSARILVAVSPPVIALLLAWGSVRTTRCGNDAGTLLKWRVVAVVVTLYVISCLLAMPGTPWVVARNGSHLPVLVALAVACTAGLMFVNWFQFATVMTYTAEYGLGEPPMLRRALGFNACGLIAIMLFRGAEVSFADAEEWKADFDDKSAQGIIEQFADVRYLGADGTLDAGLSIRTYLSGRAGPVPLTRAVSSRGTARSLGGFDGLWAASFLRSNYGAQE